MRIDDLNRTPVSQSAEKPGQIDQAGAGESKAKEAISGSDRAEVSQWAQSLSTTDPGRIEQLRLQVQSGNYEVPAQALASALVDAHLSEPAATAGEQ